MFKRAMLLVVVVIGVLFAGMGVAAAAPAEDEAGWDCTTMGNKMCGPGVGPNTSDEVVYYGGGVEVTVTADKATDKASASSSSSSYVVQAGDTLSEIAQDHGTTVAQLVADNDLDDADHILVGQRLVL